jgi:non-ribosomal peptide synthetase component F
LFCFTAEAARIAYAQATADLNMVMEQPNVPPELQGAAAVAAADAGRAAAQDHLLPLNIVEASPDGQWLAVGADQLAVVLLPAGAR